MHEHITGGDRLGRRLPEPLLADALLMLRALATDLADAGVQVVGLRDHRLAAHGLPGQWRILHMQEQRDAAVDQLVRASDATWPIAPETGGVLESLSEQVLRAGRPLLGSRPEGVRVAASKLATAQRLRQAGVAALPTFRREEVRSDGSAGWVVKPDDGCGCEDVRLFGALDAAVRWIDAQAGRSGYVIQPYLPGEPLSLSALARDGEAWLLSVNRQRITRDDGRFAYHGGVVNALPDAGGGLQRLAREVAAAIPGLWGYFGIDLIQTDSGPVVVEVNPRLTTSYAGLRAALGINPAALVLSLLSRGEFRMPALTRGRPVAVCALAGSLGGAGR